MNREKSSIHQIPIYKLVRGKYQPRQIFSQEALNELAESIRSAGLIQPLVVRPIDFGHYEIVAGERRWRAAQLASLEIVPCLVKQYTDEQTAAVTSIENVNRVDLNPIEEAESYKRLIDDFNYVHEEVAAVVGKSRTRITNLLRLLRLNENVQDFLINGELSEGHGKALAGLDATLQHKLAKQSIDNDWSVRKIEKEAKKAQSNNQSYTADSKDPNIEKLETALSDHVGCKVGIDFTDNKGQLKINFHNLEILDGLFKKMGFKLEND